MFTLVNILIFFFVILISYQLHLASLRVIEGLENEKTFQPYDEDPLILSKQNAGNIEYLRERMDNVQGLNQQVQDLSGNVQSLQDQVNGLLTAQQDYATQMAGSAPPEITGATEEEGEEEGEGQEQQQEVI
jgi:hypothetical protein